MVTRKILIDGEHYATCEFKTDGETDYYHFVAFKSEKRRQEICDAMKRNGYSIYAVTNKGVMVNHKYFIFKGFTFGLKQCSDLFEWFDYSAKGDFTYYYDRIVFHHTDGHFYAAYLEDTDNYIKI